MVLNLVEDELAEINAACMESMGSWGTRFDGGSLFNRQLILPCDLVAMHVRGSFWATFDGEDGDGEDLVYPEVYALVVLREKAKDGKVVAYRTYLQSRYTYSDKVLHDGAYDLKNAYDIAALAGNGHRGDSKTNWDTVLLRDWHLVRKGDVPGATRTILDRTIQTVAETVDRQFGQGAGFFKLRKAEGAARR